MLPVQVATQQIVSTRNRPLCERIVQRDRLARRLLLLDVSDNTDNTAVRIAGTHRVTPLHHLPDRIAVAEQGLCTVLIQYDYRSGIR